MSFLTCLGKDFLIEALKYHLLKGEQKSLFKTPRTKPRQPRGLPKVLLVVGGQAPKAIRSVECYDFKEEKWYQVSELPTRRCRAGRSYSYYEWNFLSIIDFFGILLCLTFCCVTYNI